MKDYADFKASGTKAGKARRQKDQGTVSHEEHWMYRALTRLPREERPAARKVWDDAYRAEATPEVRYFT